MGGADGQVSLGADRLKREECKPTKHDSIFSKWQILIGPSDWEDYSQGKEGAARYRVYNLPSRSCPGVYELGIEVSRSDAGGRLDLDDIVVVYLGQADNVRNRLQRYGRSGAHLSNDSSTPGHWNDFSINAASRQRGLHLFEEIFSRGHSLVFRWAPMKDKRDAEKTEADLLYTFDYAWNKGANGERRPDDILQKLNKVTPGTKRLNIFSNISKRLHILRQVQDGIKIKRSLPILQENITIPSQEKTRSFLSGVFKISRSRPRLVSNNSSLKDVPTSLICGFLMSGGIICRKPPVPGRKRCQQHKGLRTIRPISDSIAEESSNYTNDEHLASQNYQSQITACGIILDKGAFCTRKPVPGRKRCEEHKGMRANRYFPKPKAEDTCDNTRLNNAASSKCSTDDAFHDQSSSESTAEEQVSTVCGASLKNGSFCRRKPGQGYTRCWQHRRKTVPLPGLSHSPAVLLWRMVLYVLIILFVGGKDVSNTRECEPLYAIIADKKATAQGKYSTLQNSIYLFPFFASYLTACLMVQLFVLEDSVCVFL